MSLKPRISDEGVEAIERLDLMNYDSWFAASGDLALDLRDARRERDEARAVIAACHEAVGESAASDDATLADGIRQRVEALAEARAERDAAVKFHTDEYKNRVELESERDRLRAAADKLAEWVDDASDFMDELWNDAKPGTAIYDVVNVMIHSAVAALNAYRATAGGTPHPQEPADKGDPRIERCQCGKFVMERWCGTHATPYWTHTRERCWQTQAAPTPPGETRP